MPELSLIIATYERPEVLELVLASLHKQTFTDFEVIIADDGSGPAIGDAINRASLSIQQPISHVRHEHQGFRKTIIVNKAAAAATAKYLVFIDGDCIMHRRFLETHWKYRHASRVLSGRRVMLDNEFSRAITVNDVLHGRLERPPFWYKHAAADDRRHGVYIRGGSAVENALRRKNYSILGCNFSLHFRDFSEVNGYDEQIIGRGMEDNNLNTRLALNGCRIRSVTREAIMYHLAHLFDPVPFDPQTRRAMCMPVSHWAQNGISGHRIIGGQS